MSNKRDILTEIKQLKSRKEFETFWEISRRETKFETVLTELAKVEGEAKQELLKYIPISLVATFESMLRSAVKKLIDEKEICFENTKGIFPEGKLKIEFDYFKSLHKKEFTFGEFVSHQISCNRIENFDQILSTILFKEDGKFFKELRKYTPSSIYPEIPLKSNEFKIKYDIILKSLARVFELRHIASHEMSNELNLSEQEVTEFCKNAFLFLEQTYRYLVDILYPNAPETNEEMFEVASVEYEEKEQELNRVLEEIKKGAPNFYGSPVDAKLMEEAQKHWTEYRRLYVEAMLYDMRDGRDYRIFYVQELSDITDDRIDDLKHDFNIDNKLILE